MTFDGDKIVVSVAYAPPTQDELVAYASNARYAKEIGGIVVADVPVATDDRSKQMILGARVAADVDPDATQWVGADGIIYPITAAAMIMISNAVMARRGVLCDICDRESADRRRHHHHRSADRRGVRIVSDGLFRPARDAPAPFSQRFRGWR